MLIDGKWASEADRYMVSGKYRREASPLATSLGLEEFQTLLKEPGRFLLVASASCPWSHGAVITLVLKNLSAQIPIQWAGGPRVEGYGLLPDGPMASHSQIKHVHQLYSLTNPNYSGRATVPVLWDWELQTIRSNSSGDIIKLFNGVGGGPDLRPEHQASEIDTLVGEVFDGLSNAVYCAGMAERQDEYDLAVDTVFETMDRLECRLTNQHFLFGKEISLADIRLFATLARFDTVYVTHFRCTKKRLVDYPALWRFTRRIYQIPGIKETLDFDEIRFGYYVNDGSHNPHGIVGQQPEIDWENTSDLKVQTVSDH